MSEKQTTEASRFSVGQQPCSNLLRADSDSPALGPGNRRNIHVCPLCDGDRTFCENCSFDHHAGGWEMCNA